VTAGIITKAHYVVVSRCRHQVDAGVATDKNGLAGDVDPSVRGPPNINTTSPT